MDPDMVESLLFKSQSWWNHYFFFRSLSTSLKEIEGKKRKTGEELAFDYCFISLEGSERFEEASQAFWD